MKGDFFPAKREETNQCRAKIFLLGFEALEQICEEFFLAFQKILHMGQG